MGTVYSDSHIKLFFPNVIIYITFYIYLTQQSLTKRTHYGQATLRLYCHTMPHKVTVHSSWNVTVLYSGLSPNVTFHGMSCNGTDRGLSHNVTFHGMSYNGTDRGLSHNVTFHGMSCNGADRGLSPNVTIPVYTVNYVKMSKRCIKETDERSLSVFQLVLQVVSERPIAKFTYS